MTIDPQWGKILIEIIKLLGVYAAGVLTLWGGVYTGKIELKKRKPETVPYQCKLSKLDVYTFITGKKTQTPPVCPYLDTSDYVTCHFSVENDNDSPHARSVRKMKQVGENKCYIALFSREFDLE